MTDRVEKAGLQWDATLAAFVENELIPESGVEADAIWAGLAALVKAFGPKTAELLAKRDTIQEQIDAWHGEHKGQPHDAAAYKAFLTEIGYFDEAPEEVQISPDGIDPEISSMAAPQLVVPASSVRMALNAANARWGSLYDALYATDALGSVAPKGPYDPQRGAEVVAWAKAHLDEVLPLKTGSWTDVVSMAPSGGKLMMIAGKGTTELADPSQFAGYNRDDKNAITDVFFRANGLHIVLYIDRDHAIGKDDPAGIADIVVEAAASTIVDFEDSVAAVDAADKIDSYRTWLGLMKGDLTEEITRGDKTFTRELNPDIGCLDPSGAEMLMKGRSLLLCRNVGLLMTTPAVLDEAGAEIPEYLLDALISSAAARHDLIRKGPPKNSPRGSIYIVKPKMHSAEEVALTDQVFSAVESVLTLPENTLKMGIMDEERRMSVNLKAAIAAAPKRIAFINTGFL
ncbi:MAG: malate synthase G, partial [Pseudomonadota bacterium]